MVEVVIAMIFLEYQLSKISNHSQEKDFVRPVFILNMFPSKMNDDH